MMGCLGCLGMRDTIKSILHVDLAPVKELVSLQRRCANNLNQVAVHANTFGVYPEEIAGLQRDYEKR